jgi:DNA-binding MarR family transcriptional regulator
MTGFTDRYARASKAYRAVVTVALRRHGLHLGQNFVIAALTDQDGQTPGEIAAKINVSTPTIVKMATRMGAAGLLERRRDTSDRRLVRLHLTEAGRALAGPMAAELAEVEQRLTSGLTTREAAQLLTLMERVAGNAGALLAEWDEEPGDL